MWTHHYINRNIHRFYSSLHKTDTWCQTTFHHILAELNSIRTTFLCVDYIFYTCSNYFNNHLHSPIMELYSNILKIESTVKIVTTVNLIKRKKRNYYLPLYSTFL